MKGLEFKINIQGDLLYEKYKSDQGRIKQVLLNLISNSLKFTERGGSIKVDIVQVTHSFDQYLKFSVTDSGIGIPAKDMSKLFQMFSMLDKHKKEMNQKGTGIGLAISKKIVESLGGKLVVKSEEGEYSQFSFTIFCHPMKCMKNMKNVKFMEEDKNKTNELFFMSQKQVSFPRRNPSSSLMTPLMSKRTKYRRNISQNHNITIFADSQVNLNKKEIDEAKSELFSRQLLKGKVPNTSRAILEKHT